MTYEAVIGLEVHVQIKTRSKMFTRVAAGYGEPENTLTDPTVLEKPWTFTFAYQKMKDYTLLEYICEDNREFADDQGRQKIRVDPSPR